MTRFRTRMEVGDANEGFESDKRMACLGPLKVSASDCILRMTGPDETQGLTFGGLGCACVCLCVCERVCMEGNWYGASRF